MELALEAASLHPAQLLGLEKRKGTLDFGADAGQGPMWPHGVARDSGGLRTWDGARAAGVFPVPRWPCPASHISPGPSSHQAR